MEPTKNPFYNTRFRKLKYSLKQHITSRAHYNNVLNTNLQPEYINRETKAQNIEAEMVKSEILPGSSEALEDGEIKKRMKYL